MEAILNKRSIRCFSKVYESTINREETAESVVPDTQPDIAEILDTDGTILLRSKDVEQGRVGVSGNISTTVLYMPDGGSGVKTLGGVIPFSVYLESPVITEDTRPVAVVRVCAIEARMLNPRKVLIRADEVVTISCFEGGELELRDELEEPADIQVLLSSNRFSPVTDVREKTFVINEDYQMPMTKSAIGELLKHRAEIIIDDIKIVGNKLIFKGSAQISAIYIGVGDEVVSPLTFSLPFSQIMDMEGISEDADAQVNAMLTGAYVETSPDGRTLTCELHLVAQAVASDIAEFSYIADAYSNTNELRLDVTLIETTTIERRLTIRETIRDVVETPSPVRETVQLYSVMGVPEIVGGKVRCQVTVRVMYRDDTDVLRNISKNFSLESNSEIEPPMEASVTEMRCVESFASPTSGGLELRVPFDIDLLIIERQKHNMITSMESDEDAPMNTANWPSVTVLMIDGEPDIWKLAKKYRSTPELIEAANASEEEHSGELLLIPKAR